MEYRKIEIKQSRGPRIEFEGRLLACDSFEVRRDGTNMALEVWETRGGALIAVTRGEVEQRGEAREIVAATVVEPAYLIVSQVSDGWRTAGPAEINEQAMRFAVMDAFDWNDRARSMVRKQLRWKLSRTVE